MMTRDVSDRECVEIALSIAVPVREPRARADKSLGKRCESAPDGLDQLMSCGRRSPLRRSPTQSRRANKPQRRRMSFECSQEQRGGRARSGLDLSTLDFSLSEARGDALSAEPIEEEETLSIGLNECDITSKGVEHITRALSFVSVNDKKPLIELQLAYNNLGNQGIASLIWAAKHGSVSHLRRLVLTGNRLSDMSGLAGAFANGKLPAVKELVLSSNRITAAGVAELAHAVLCDGFPAIGHVERLYLDHNEIGHVEADEHAGEDIIICESSSPSSGTHHGSSVTKNVSVEAVVALANACTSALTLDLGTNGLDDSHLDALAASIAAGKAFSRSRGDAYPVGVGVGSSSPERLATATRKEWSCARLDVSLNKYTRVGRERLEAACRQHGGIRCCM